MTIYTLIEICFFGDRYTVGNKNTDYVTTKNIVKKRLMVFPSPAGMSLTKLSLARKN